MLLFGNDDGNDDTNFYYDEANDIWVGCISDNPRIEYFGYLKKMCLTLHNLAQMKKGMVTNPWCFRKHLFKGWNKERYHVDG